MKACTRCQLRYPVSATRCAVDGAELMPARDPRLGSLLGGRYRVEARLGEGGMATVYRARDELSERSARECALKVLHPVYTMDPVVRERFRREARSAEKLAHPNVIAIHGQGETEDGTAFIAMELLFGRTLADAIEDGPIELERALALMVQVARGIARAHDLEVTHRDLKPENIFLCAPFAGATLRARAEPPHVHAARLDETLDMPDGSFVEQAVSAARRAPEHVKILDFGIARSRSDSRLTAAGELFGTPQYMAPERMTGGGDGPSVDLYALGVVFFEMLTGVLPFHATDATTFLVKHVREAPPSPRSIVPSIPEPLEALVLALLEKDPKARPVDAHRVHRDLLGLAEKLGAAIPEVSAGTKAPSAPPRRGHADARPPARTDRQKRAIEALVARARTPAPLESASLRQLCADVFALAAHMEADVAPKCVAASEARSAVEEALARGREGRNRIGRAVDVLGQECSLARDELRKAEDARVSLDAAADAAAAAFRTCHAEVVFWEGRSGLASPLAELAEAYRRAADANDAWRTAAEAATAARSSVARHRAGVSDLEFQIRALREALATHEAAFERERAELEEAAARAHRAAREAETALAARVRTLSQRVRDELRTERPQALADAPVERLERDPPERQLVHDVERSGVRVSPEPPSSLRADVWAEGFTASMRELEASLDADAA
jgi:serine/threonine-protein kinase